MADNGHAGWEIFLASCFDLVVTDRALPQGRALGTVSEGDKEKSRTRVAPTNGSARKEPTESGSATMDSEIEASPRPASTARTIASGSASSRTTWNVGATSPST